MELLKQDVLKLDALLAEWLTKDTYELEATFGGPRGLDMTDFMSVIKRIKARYGDGDKQDNRLTITLQNHSRFTLTDNASIEQYCISNDIHNKQFEAITKTNTGRDSDLPLVDYNVNIKTRNEQKMNKAQIQEAVKGWKTKLKAFRLINRWSFKDPGKNVRIDASIVYSTKKIRKGNRFDYDWSVDYKDLKLEPPTYEIEVELLHSDANNNVEHARKVLISNIGEVLRGIQKSPVLITTKMTGEVLAAYKSLLQGDPTKDPEFRGNPPKTLLYNNILPHEEQEDEEKGKNQDVSLYDGYNVTDKADGLRVLAFTDPEGELFMIDMSLHVYRTGLKNLECKNCLLDGEWVTTSKKDKPIQQLCLFDVFIINERDVSQLPFVDENADPDIDTRLQRLQTWVQTWNKVESLKDLLPTKDGKNRKSALNVSCKEFLVGKKGNNSIFLKAAEMLNKTNDPNYLYKTDGLIFTPNSLPLPTIPRKMFAEQFKWKPSADNTIDFLIKAKLDKNKKEEIEFSQGSNGEPIRYKSYTLYVKSQVDPLLEDPRKTVLQNQGIPTSFLGTQSRPQGGKPFHLPYSLVPFKPDVFEDPKASICHIPIKENEDFTRAENGEPLRSDMIVEMNYDPSETDPEYRWKPVRIRHDKTARYTAAMKKSNNKNLGPNTINGFGPAMDVWRSIHNPVTEHMIRTGDTTLNVKEVEDKLKDSDPSINRYYQNSMTTDDRKIIETMTRFHNRYIKEQILLMPTVKHAGSKALVDLAVGQGSDIGRWYRAGVNFAFGVDKALFGIVDKDNGAYRRYLKLMADNFIENQKIKARYDRGDKKEPLVLKPLPPMLFAAGDSSLSIPDGTSAGENKIDAMIMRSLFGKGTPDDAPAYLKTNANKLAKGAGVAAMMFAIHYMFETQKTLDGFIENLKACVQVGGYFVGCCFDGDRVFNLLKQNKIAKGQTLERSVTRKDGIPVKIWSIERMYDEGDTLHYEDVPESYGQGIRVSFISIGKPYTEYLVPFTLLEKKLNANKFRLLNAKELATLGLQHSTNTFDQSWEMAKQVKDRDGNPYFKDESISEEVKEFSFLNRWFIFTRDEGTVEQPKESDLPAMQNVTVSGTTQDGGAIPRDPSAKKEYDINDVFQFHMEAPLTDRFKLGDKSAARWLAPISRFPIQDPDGKSYPSLDHYMAAMRYKYGATKKDGSPVDDEFLQVLFGQDGSIHQRALRAEVRERGENNIEDDQLKVILKQEYDEIQKQLKPSGMKSHGLVADDASWSEHREPLLREGLRQRWEKDERFRKHVIALAKQNKYMLYYNPAVGMSYYGGMRKANKTIEGENMVGRILMDLAGFDQSK